MSLLGRVSRQPALLFRHVGITATASAAVLVLAAGGTFAAMHVKTSPRALVPVGNTKPLTHVSKPKPVIPVEPLKVVSVSPHSGAKDVNGATSITVKFSSALAPMTPLPKLSPKISGSWQVSGATATFTPSLGYLPETRVTVKIPGGSGGVEGLAATAGVLGQTRTVKFTTGSFSTIRLQQVLTQLGYLPLTWTPDGTSTAPVPAGSVSAQLSAAYDPPQGSFAFKAGYPSELTSQWQAGSANMLDQGAIMAFESNEGLTMDGVAGTQVWSDLFKAAAENKVNPNGYTYALVSQHYPEELTVWHDGKVIERTPANTGIPGRGTQDGTFAVYLRYQFNYMNGTNPDGSKYHDPVYWISYFNGGDALHYFPRPGYGYYQSLGCVELQWDPAKYIWNYTTYGTLVTVMGPEA